MEWHEGLVVTKDSDSVLDWKFDWKALANGSGDSNWLDTSETIASATVTVASGLTKDSDSITDTNTSVTVWLSGGTEGTIYNVTCQIVTSDGRTAERSIKVLINEK